MSFLSYLRSLVHNGAERKKARQAPRCRPALEGLEDRCTPSSLSGWLVPATQGGQVNYAANGFLTGQVFLKNQSTGQIIRVSETTGGHYSFSGLSAGVYELIVPLSDIYGNKEAALTGVRVGTVNGKVDGHGVATPGLASIQDIQLGANSAGVNYDFLVYAPLGLSGGIGAGQTG